MTRIEWIFTLIYHLEKAQKFIISLWSFWFILCIAVPSYTYFSTPHIPLINSFCKFLFPLRLNTFFLSLFFSPFMFTLKWSICNHSSVLCQAVCLTSYSNKFLPFPLQFLHQDEKNCMIYDVTEEGPPLYFYYSPWENE